MALVLKRRLLNCRKPIITSAGDKIIILIRSSQLYKAKVFACLDYKSICIGCHFMEASLKL